MANFSTGSVKDLVANVAFKDLIQKLKHRLHQVEETSLIHPDPFTHGRGVGEREVIRYIFDQASQGLYAEASGESSVKKLR